MTPTSTPDPAPAVACDAAATARLLDWAALVDAVATAAADVADGRLRSPERQVVPLARGGVMLSMPAAADDLAIHKLVNVQPANAALGLPTIHGLVTAFDGATGRPLCTLDGPEVTGRRTAAVTLLAACALLGRAPREVLLVGTGVQARHHVHALRALHPDARVRVRARRAAAAEAFCRELQAAHPGLAPFDPAGGPLSEAMLGDVDLVIAATTSTEPVIDLPARAGRVVVGVGAFRPDMAEIGATTLAGSDLWADDPAGARHEAGDLLRAGVDWSRVGSLAALLRGPVDPSRPAVFKSVGSAAWDLAAARCAVAALRAEGRIA